jgi:nitrite reductase (NADH) small subunit/3-phenylpropionate/trans-cinnamate dioxygenase ferredoxin subunit
MGERVKVAEANQIAPGQRKLVKVKGHEIALFNIEGNFYAIANRCPHSTGPLVEGRLFKHILTCPWHGAQFDITTGQCYSGPATTDVTCYPTYIEDNAVYIETA